ncbi:MAG: hypothetical protein IJM51_12280 [Clostridia bacterium]|nr:hypothetical protein [Clostridia bacterium]
MLLLAYFLLLALVFLISVKWKPKHRTYLILAYNFLFVFGAHFYIRTMTQGLTGESFIPFVGHSLYNTVQNLTFDGDVGEWANVKNDIWMEAQAWLVVFSAAILNVQYLLLTIFYRTFAQARLRMKVLIAKNQTVIVGKVEDAKLLVDDTMKKSILKPRIVFIPTDEMPDDCALYQICRIEDKSFLDHLKPRKNYTVVLLPDKEYVNLERVHSLNQWAEQNKKNVGKIRVSVFLDNDLERFRNFKADHLDTCVISKEEIAVRSYLEKCPPINLLADANAFEKDGLPYLKDPFRMCVIGFSTIGQEFLLLTYENTAFPTKNNASPFAALVLDSDLDAKKAAFLTEAPYFAEGSVIEFVDAAYHSDRYYDTIRQHAAEWNQIVVATDDTKANVDIAIKLCRTYDNLGLFDKRPQITVVFHHSYAGAENLLNKYPNIKVVDVKNQLHNYKTLIDRSIDLSAQEANRNYNQLSNKGTVWNNLGTFLEASNRAQALDVPVKKKLFAMSRASQSQTIEFLARYEHNRWMAFSFAHGWMPMSVSELTAEEKANYRTKHAFEKRHICLVPWDELDKLPQKTPGLLKSYDVESVNQALSIAAKV